MIELLAPLQTRYLELISRQQNAEAEALYWSELYQLVQEAVNSRLPVAPGTFDLLISLVGLSPEPLILTINALKPGEVVFLVSPETKGQLDLIFEKTSLKPSQAKWIEIDSSKVEQVYQQIRDVVSRYAPEKVAIDITGGKKSMVGGAAQAAALLGCAAFYVDYDEYHPQFRKPNPGSEYLSFLKNPYEVFGEIDDRRARDLYESGDYGAAVELASRLAQKLVSSREQEIKRSIYATFQKWEDYQFSDAQRSAQNALKLSRQFNLLTHLQPELEKRLDTLQKIIGNNPLYIALNHYYLAIVFSARGKYDFAILLLYRTIELLFSQRLFDGYQLLTSKPDYSPWPDLLQKYNEQLPLVYGPTARISNELPAQIGLMATATLLKIWDDPLTQNLDLKLLREQADQRNQGILAHGLKPNTQKQFDSMNKFFKPVFEKYIDTVLDAPQLNQLEQLFGRIPL